MTRDRLSELAQRRGIRMILCFGSTVTGRQHPGSDLDLAVLFGKLPTFEDEMGLLADLQEVYSDREVDLAILNRADPLLLKQIAEHCQLVYGAPRDLCELKMLAFKRYQDYRPYLALESRYVERTLQALAP